MFQPPGRSGGRWGRVGWWGVGDSPSLTGKSKMTAKEVLLEWNHEGLPGTETGTYGVEMGFTESMQYKTSQ